MPVGELQLDASEHFKYNVLNFNFFLPQSILFPFYEFSSVLVEYTHIVLNIMNTFSIIIMKYFINIRSANTGRAPKSCQVNKSESHMVPDLKGGTDISFVPIM